MATNKLMEAAAEVLANSMKTATAEPMHKMAGAEVEDLGGPTPQNSKPNDDSNKINVGARTPDTSAKNKSSISTKPSAASSDTQLHMKNEEEEYDTEDEELLDEVSHMMKKKDEMKAKMKEDIDALFGDETLSEEFKSKAATIFEARVMDRVEQIEEELESRYMQMLENSVEALAEELTEKVDDYLNYVVEQWLSDNEIAIESGLRAELTEEFIAGLRNLFAEHYIDVPAEKVDLVDELASKIEELESKLDEEIERNIDYKKALVEAVKAEIAREVCDGLTATQAEKIKSLAESVDFSTEEEYKEKLETIRENYFPTGVKKANENQLHEQVEDADDKKVDINDPFVAAVSRAISKTSK
jgi:exonuclease VII large subunit